VENINEKQFNYRVSVNDVRIMPYHRSNAITALDYINPNTNKMHKVMNVANGLLWTVDVFNKAYMKYFFKDINIITGVQIMPVDVDSSDNIQRIINICGSTFYPMAVSLLMPLFMYTIVLEKESKLIEIMKINGMKMRYYWLSNFVFNFSLYAATMFIFQFFGMFVLDLGMFIETNFLLLVRNKYIDLVNSLYRLGFESSWHGFLFSSVYE
jgi:hypothetical protein